MLSIIPRRLCKCTLKISENQLRYITSISTAESQKQHCLISCKRRQFDYYTNMTYNKFDEIPLASKGWTHSKSKGDYFTINAFPEEYAEATIPFNLLGIDKNLIAALQKLDIQKATEYQSRVIPSISMDKHFMLAAETGCGKTIAYLLPIIQSLMKEKSEKLNAPRALILLPNRELAHQVGEIAQILCETVGLTTKILIGGRTKKLMMTPEFDNIDILVATPGVIGKLSTVGIYHLNQVLYTVIDEADTLTDDSFIDRMTGIIKKVSQSKVILVSATLPQRLPDILKPIEENLYQITSPKLHKPLLNITQKFLRINRAAKPSHLLQIAKTNNQPLIIFTNRNERCNWLSMFLRENGVPCSYINGDMNYALRIEQWNQFIKGETKILSSTDVGSRGLDTTQVRHVLNYDFPIYAADYLHRIGRIGRLGSHVSCKATNFISGAEEVKLVQEIELAVRKNQALTNVDGNITNIVQKKILRGMKQTS